MRAEEPPASTRLVPNRIAALVLACASPPYDRLIEAIRGTWGAPGAPGIDVYYLYGNPDGDQARRVLSRHLGGRAPVVPGDGICQIDDVLIAGCADDLRRQEDCLLRKRLLAFGHLAADDRYDLVYTVCAASYVDRDELRRYADSLFARRLVAGAVGVDLSRRAPFVSGASMILSVDVARELGRHRQEIIAGNAFGFRDDVAIGHWIATRLARVPLETIIADIEQARPLSAEHVFVRHGQGTVDYVTAPAHAHQPVPGAFHYHFHRDQPDALLRFHQRYFGAGAPAAVGADASAPVEPHAAAALVGTTNAAPSRPRIFVSIASYRDPFLPFTIRSVLGQAKHPERLTLGICWQADEEERLDEFLDDPRFRIRRYPYHASLGYGWARAEIQKLYAGEEYHLLIDSHSFLAAGWDENLIAQLEAKPGRKPLLTTSSPPFTFDGEGRVVLPWAGTALDGVPLMQCERLEPGGWIDIQMASERSARRHQTTGLICCNFVFTHGAWIREVPEDPAMINAGHEAALSARTFTHGYDIYLPDEIQVWHLDYGNYPDGKRHKVWEAKSSRWQAEHTDEMIRRNRVLFYGQGDPMTLGRHGLGEVRSVAAWGEAVGLDLGAPAACHPDTNVDEGHLGGYIRASAGEPTLEHGDPATWYPELWRWLADELGVRSVLDVGGAEGHAARFFRDAGCEVLTVDGSLQARRDSVVPESHVVHDFVDGPFVPPRAFDLVWSCEFVEHVEERFANHFLSTFASSGRYVLMTYATPDQPGWHHVNCRGETYWIDALTRRGFRFDAALTARARRLAGGGHFGSRGLAFVR